MPTPEEVKAAADKAAADKAAADKAAADKAAADKVAAAKSADERAGSIEGATSVAEAVRRVADAAVAEVQKRAGAAGPSQDLAASGVAGGRVVVTGSGFGSSGTLTVNGVQVTTREWSTTRIVGDLPANATSGEVVVHVDDKTTKRGSIKL